MKIVQMDVAEGERELQRQRRQRQQRTTSLMAMNEVHLIPTSPQATMLALQM
jgi:NAD kinase